jgi:hypothetical protein
MNSKTIKLQQLYEGNDPRGREIIAQVKFSKNIYGAIQFKKSP